MKTEKELEAKTMREVNRALYESLLALFYSHIANGGNVDFPEKDYGFLADDLDILLVKYFGEEPDGTFQNELAEDGEEMMNDEEAFDLIIARFTNTRIEFTK